MLHKIVLFVLLNLSLAILSCKKDHECYFQDDQPSNIKNNSYNDDVISVYNVSVEFDDDELFTFGQLSVRDSFNYKHYSSKNPLTRTNYPFSELRGSEYKCLEQRVREIKVANYLPNSDNCKTDLEIDNHDVSPRNNKRCSPFCAPHSKRYKFDEEELIDQRVDPKKRSMESDIPSPYCKRARLIGD